MAARKRWLDRLRWSLWVEDIVEMTERTLGGVRASGADGAAAASDGDNGRRSERARTVSAARGDNGK